MSFPLNVRDVFGSRLSAVESREGTFRGVGRATVTVDHVGPVGLLLRADVLNNSCAVDAELVGLDTVVACKAAVYDTAAGKFVSRKCLLERGADYSMRLVQLSGPEDNVRQDGEWTDEGDAWLKTFTICVTDVVADGLFWML